MITVCYIKILVDLFLEGMHVMSLDIDVTMVTSYSGKQTTVIYYCAFTRDVVQMTVQQSQREYKFI